MEGKPLLQEPYEKRRSLLEENVKPIPNHVQLAEMTFFTVEQEIELSKLMGKVLKEGLEGLVIKDRLSTYEPNMRHWNKMKKDYLSGMADSADLLVLGAYYGTGRMGGLRSVFLMGVHDPKTGKFKTVCRVTKIFMRYLFLS